MSEQPQTAPYARPWWLILPFALQGLVWIGHFLWALIAIAWGASRGAGHAAVLGFNLLVTLLVTGMFIGGLVAPLRKPPQVRFAMVHNAAGLLVTVASALSVGLLVATQSKSWSEGMWPLVFAVAGLAVPIAGMKLSRSKTNGWVIAACILGVCWLFAAAFVFFGMGIGIAGITV